MAKFGLARRERPLNSLLSRTSGANDGALLNWEVDDVLLADIVDLTPSSRPPLPRAHPQRPPLRRTETTAQAAPPWRAADALEFAPPEPDERIDALRLALDDALAEWWGESQLPGLPLLRDALLALEAGHELDEGHRTLLLRAALAARKGILTALRHQSDPERTAFLIKESALDPFSPLPPTLLWQIKEEDRGSPGWLIPLERELKDELRVTQGLPHQLAMATLAALSSDQLPTNVGLTKPRSGNLLDLGGAHRSLRPAYWSPGRVVIVVLLVVSMLAGLVQPGRSAATGMVRIPEGDYRLYKRADQPLPHVASLTAFAIDRTEVTNANYRQCVLVGHCQPPAAERSNIAPRLNERQFDEHPVVQVSWTDAQRFCTWLGKRLPTAEEWEVAASVAATAERAYRYPWGDSFDVQRANVRESQVGATRSVASYAPRGDSSFGLADMAGNVAEWTATMASGEAGSHGQHIVKGGSYADGRRLAEVTSEQLLPATTVAPWLGFRCAADLPQNDFVKLVSMGSPFPNVQ